MTLRPVFPLTIFYDGSCSVCAREMDRYRRKPHQERLAFVDISAPEFAPESYGRSREQFMQQLHVRDAAGRFYCGVDAFPVIWRALPGRGYRLLGGLLALPGLHQLARLGYKIFARLRRYLPRVPSDAACSPDHRH